LNRKLERYHWISLGLVALLGLAAFVQLLDRFYPYRAANIRLSRKQAIAIAEEFLDDERVQVERYRLSATLQYDQEAFLYLQSAYGLATAQDWLKHRRHMGLDFCWNLNYYLDLPRNAPQHRYFVGINGQGDVSFYIHNLPPDMDWPRPESARLSKEDARRIALTFLEGVEVDLTDFSEGHYTATERSSRVDHHFVWEREAALTGCNVKLLLNVSGDEVTLYNFAFEIPPEASVAQKQQAGNAYFLNTVVSLFALFLVGLVTLFIFLKKYHEGEVEVRSGAMVFFILWGAFILQALLRFQINASGTSLGELSKSGVALFIFFLFVLIIRPILSLFGFTAWSVGESLARESKGIKLRAMDAIMNKRFFTLDLAKSILQGYLGGAIALGLLAVLQTVAIEQFNAVVPISGVQTLLPSPMPGILAILIAVWTGLLGELLFRFFGNLWLAKVLRRKSLAVMITSLFWAFYVSGFWKLHVAVHPLGLNLVIAFILGVFFSLLFWRYDLLTVIMANFVVIGAMHTLPLLVSSSQRLFYAGFTTAAVMLMPMVVMILGFIRRERFTIKVDRTPAHIRRITERVRMSRELEIARQVQMKLLPKESPVVEGFTIKGGCIPAQEVGGDYYDFIDLGPNKLGIVVGDVSGKGVPAAIYMTLTKGIIQSHQDGLSPKEILIRVNNMLYRSIEKETFVSLFYAVLDIKKRTLTYARAGHNPLIHYHAPTGQCELLEPHGIALGLEEGTRFSAVIQEKKRRLEEGDVIAFYTDGFTEAMNLEKEEYGEDRLVTLIEKHHYEPVNELYKTVLRDVHRFVDQAPQHDDMTLVFVKA